MSERAEATVGVGIIGCGYWGPNLTRNFHEVAGVRVIGCADLRAERRAHMQQRFPSLLVTEHDRELIDHPDIQAICIATPTSTHAKLAREALQAGKHVLVEKPLAMASQDVKLLDHLAREQNVVLMVGHTFEYSGAVNAVKELVASGALGTIYYFDSTRVNLGKFQPDINVVWDLATHDLSIMHYCLGQVPVSVSVVAESHVHAGTEDVAFITMRFRDRLIGHIHVSWLEPVKLRRTVFGGSQQMIVYDDTKPAEKVLVYDKGVDVARDPSGLLERQLIYRTGAMHAPVLNHQEPLRTECEHFIDCIVEGRTPRSDAASGLRVVQVLEAIQASLEAGGSEVEVCHDES